MLSGNENTSVTPNFGSTPNSGAAPHTTSGSGLNLNQEEECINSLASSNQGQDPAQQSWNNTREDELGMPGNFLVANAVLASCNDVLKDFYSSRVSKAVVLSRIYTVLLNGIPTLKKLVETLKKLLNITSLSLRIIRTILTKLKTMDAVNSHKAQSTEVLKLMMKRFHLLNVRNPMKHNIHGWYQTSYMVLLYPHPLQPPSNYLNSMHSTLKARNDLLSIPWVAWNFLTQNGPMSFWVVPSILMQFSVDII